MYLKNLFTAADIGQRNNNLTVKTAGTQQCRVKNVRTVSRSNNDNAGISIETVHLHEHLIQGLLALVVATAETRAALATHCINFINEDNAGRILLRVLEHVANTSRANTDEHFYEVGTGNGKERNLRFACNRFGEQRLTGTRRADKQNAAGNASAKALIFGRVFQIIDHFGDFFFSLVTAGDIRKCDVVIGAVKHSGFGFAKTEGAAFAAALHLTHEENPNTDEENHREPGDEDRSKEALLFVRLTVNLNTRLAEIFNHPKIAGRGNLISRAFRRRDSKGSALNINALNFAFLSLVHELGVARGRFRSRDLLSPVELFKHSKQNQSNNDPDSNFGK